MTVDPAKAAKQMAEFTIPFANAVVKLKRALDAYEGTTLNPEEVKALIEALKLIRPAGGDDERG